MESPAQSAHHSALLIREASLRKYFGLTPEADLQDLSSTAPEMTPALAAHFSSFNLEWYVIPPAQTAPFDDRYCSRLYARAPATFTDPSPEHPSVRDLLAAGHRRHQGRTVAVETTMKPAYLPGHTQYYGSAYGHDATADPFAAYMDQAGLGGTRYGHNYLALRALIDLLDDRWRARGLLPPGYRVAICPPVVFNLIGTVFHPEWSETESLELGFYVGGHASAQCFAVGPNGPGDLSYVQLIETATEWKMFGFRIALVPE
jgi:hypothetical protein